MKTNKDKVIDYTVPIIIIVGLAFFGGFSMGIAGFLGSVVVGIFVTWIIYKLV